MRYSQSRLRWLYLNHDEGFSAGVLLALFGSGFLLLGLYVTAQEARYFFKGVQTDAVVVNAVQAARRPGLVPAWVVLAHAGGRHRQRYRVVYDFKDDQGLMHQASAAVSRDQWLTLKRGDPLEVEYLLDDPENARLYNPWRPWLCLGLGLTGVMSLFVGAGLTILTRRWQLVRQRIGLLESGIPVLALIDEVQILRKRKYTRIEMTYRYLPLPAMEAQPQVRKVCCQPFAGGIKRWQAADFVLVILDPTNPDRHEVDWFEARQDDLQELLPRTGLHSQALLDSGTQIA